MPTLLSSPDVLRKSYVRLWGGRRELLPLSGALFAVFLLAGVARMLFPGLYTFRPSTMGWLLIPEAMAVGPLLALLHHRIMNTGREFGWSRDNRLVKLGKAAAYYYVLLIVFMLGTFATTEVVPALVAYVFGPAVGGVFPILVAVAFVAFMLLFARFVLVYPFLAGETKEPLIQAILLSKGKTRQIVSCLLLLAAPVLIPWIAADAYGGDWLNPSLGSGLRILPILTRSLLLTVGALLISSGCCVMQETLVAESGDLDQDA